MPRNTPNAARFAAHECKVIKAAGHMPGVVGQRSANCLARDQLTRNELMASSSRRTKTPEWVETLRKSLRNQCGKGWQIREIRNKVQITYQFNDEQRTRTSVVVDLPWASSSQSALIALAARMEPMVQQGKTLKDAYAVLSPEKGATDAAGGADWEAITESFKSNKTGSGKVSERTWHRNYRLRIQRALDLLAGTPRPISGEGLLNALVAKHFPKGKGAGTTDRRLAIQYVAQFLTHAVDKCGAEPRWLPPEDQKDLIGITGKGKVLTTPAKDDQIVRLLPELADSKWRTAVGLVACFGLRGVELSQLSVNDELLHVGYRKRTARNPEGTAPRDVVGLDPIGLEGLSENLLAQLMEHGDAALPPGCLTARAGDALHQYLERNGTWQKLKAETAETPRSDGGGQELIPYSLRHGYALRAHELYEITPRRAAALMGHSLQTHSTTYGGWTDREMLESTAADVKVQITKRRLESLV